MKKLIICLLITLTGLLGQNALAKDVRSISKPTDNSGFVTVTYTDGTTSTGTTLDAGTASSYLKDICGATNTSGNTWTLSSSKKPSVASDPNASGVYFVEVNDYWIGMRPDTWDVYTQMVYGVKKISAVNKDSSQGTSTGTFYTHPATSTNKFYFIKLASSLRYAETPFGWYDEWSYVTDSGVNGSKGWDALEPTWEQLMDGEPFPAPHNCGSSLENNHYVALDGKSPADSKGHDFTAYLYIPTKHADGSAPNVTYEEVTVKEYQYVSSGTTYYIYDVAEFTYTASGLFGYEWTQKVETKPVSGLGDDIYCKNETGDYVKVKELYPGKYYTTESYDNKKNVTAKVKATVPAYKYQEVTKTKKVVKDGECPYVFFYAVGLNGALGAKQTSTQYNPYTVNLDWSTAFDKFATNGVQQHAKYDGGGDATKGIQEHYLVKRSYDKTNWETVTDQIIVQGNNVTNKADYKKTTDSQLKKFDETTELIGYTVYYQVTSYVEKLTSDGTPGTRMSETTSNIVRVDIPGKVPFKLTLAGEGSSVYNPTTTNNGVEYGNATNTFTNTIISAESTVEDAEKVVLTSKAELTLNAVDADGNITKELYRVANPTGNTSLDALAKLIDNVNAAGNKKGEYRDAMTLLAGDKMTAAYQLKLEILGEDNKVESQTFSNILRINNTAIGMDETVKAHRSGTPDAATCAPEETFHNEIKFLASTKQVGTGYYIYKDAKSSDPADPTNYWKKLIYSTDSQGKEGFREDGSNNYYYPDVNGYLTITDIFESAPIAVGEDENAENDVLANVYSVAFYDGKGNTYGSPRGDALYEGNQDELAVRLTSVDLKCANFSQPGNYNVYVLATITWTTPKTQYADANPKGEGEEAFKIYVSRSGENLQAGETLDGVQALADESGFEEITIGESGKLTADANTYTFAEMYDSEYQKKYGKFPTKESLLDHVKTYKFYVKMINADDEIKNSEIVVPTPTAGAIWTELEGIEAADMDVKVVNGVVEVSGVTGAIKVVNAAGALVAEAEGNGDVTEIAGLTTGVYVVTAKNMKPTKILIK